MLKYFLRGLCSEVVGYLVFFGLLAFCIGAVFLLYQVAGEWAMLVVFVLIIAVVTARSAWQRAKYLKQQEASHG